MLSTRLLRWGFTRSVKRMVRKEFESVQVELPDDWSPPSGPLLVAANHPSWWDPMIATLIADRWFRDREHISAMDADMLERYSVLKKLGFLPVDHSSISSVRTFLQQATTRLRDNNAVLWITPQGHFADPRLRPLKFAPGISHLAKHVLDLTIQPVALEYTFWDTKKPQVLVSFCKPISTTEPDAAKRAERALENQLDHLASLAIDRDPERFTTQL